LPTPATRRSRSSSEIGLPAAIRPAYTLGGTGGGFARTPEEFERSSSDGLEYSPITRS
jgi:carbamoyl-phosphate synthase large subunit